MRQVTVQYRVKGVRPMSTTSTGGDPSDHGAPSWIAPQAQETPEPAPVRLYQEQRVLAIGGAPVRLTPLEYRLMTLLARRPGAPISFDALSRAAFDRNADSEARQALEKHMDRLRSKLRPYGATLPCVMGYGYLLLICAAHESE